MRAACRLLCWVVSMAGRRMDVGTGPRDGQEGERTAGGEVLDKRHLSRFLTCARSHGCGFEGGMGVEMVLDAGLETGHGNFFFF